MDVLTIPISPETLRALDAKAQRDGKTREDYVRALIETDLLAAQPFSQILAPIREGVRESGMTEAELDALFEAAREKVYQERRTESR
jgi:hypothetical protein